MEWWNDFWVWVDASQFRAGVASTLVVAGVLGLVAAVPKWRKPVFAAVKRSYDFIRSLRVTTTKRLEAHRTSALEEGRNSARAEMSATTVAPAPGEVIYGTSPGPQKFDVGKLAGIAADEVAGIAVPNWNAAKNLIEATRNDDDDQRRRDVAQQPPQPLAEWHLEYAPSILFGSDKAWVFRLTNQADDVEPRRVKVTSNDDRLNFPDGSFWSQVGPLETKRFFGVPGRGGGKGPVLCTVSWVENNKTFTRELTAGFKIV